MFDLSSFSLEALLNISIESDLIASFRMTEWVAVLAVDGRDFVMNHDNARIFLQGLIYGAALKSRNPVDRPSYVEGRVRTSSPDRVAIG